MAISMSLPPELVYLHIPESGANPDSGCSLDGGGSSDDSKNDSSGETHDV